MVYELRKVGTRTPVRRSQLEAPALAMAVGRLLLQRPGLSLAPGQYAGKDHEHRHHGGGNQYRIDRHNDLLLIPLSMAILTRRSLIRIKLLEDGRKSISIPPN